MPRRTGRPNGPLYKWLRKVATLKIRETILFCNGNQRRAARMLGISRFTLMRYLRDDEIETRRRDEQPAHQEQAPSPTGAPETPKISLREPIRDGPVGAPRAVTARRGRSTAEKE